MRSPAVSAIVAVRDGEAYVAEALESIIGQTRPPDQVIVVDDGSRDETSAVVARFAPEVTLIRRERESVGAALNAGLAAADGDLIALLDADDLWTMRKLELQCAAMARDPELDLAFGHVEQFISPELSEAERRRLRVPTKSAPAKAKGALLARSEVFDRVGPFGTSWRLVDWVDWYARALEHSLREEMMPEVILRRRIHRTNIGRGRRAARVEYARALAEARRRRAGRPASS